MENKENIIVKLSFEFSKLIIGYTELLENSKKYVISRQLMRSGTSIGANIHEAQHCESKADFIHKMKIASKEAFETEYWLLLCKESENYPDSSQLLEKLISIQKLLSKIISTSKANN